MTVIFTIKDARALNILVLNGSPKGEYSITLQTVNYLKLFFPEQNFETYHVGTKLRRSKEI